MKRSADALLIGGNRWRAAWALVMIAVAVPLSGLFLYLGLKGGRASLSWMMVLFGFAGVISFIGFGIAIVQILRSHWHLSVQRIGLSLTTPTYELRIPWERVAGIAVAEVAGQPGCVLVFDDIAAVARSAVFHSRLVPAGSVTGAASMEARMAQSFRERGYHLAIPGRILEVGPEALAELLTTGRTGQLWSEG